RLEFALREGARPAMSMAPASLAPASLAPAAPSVVPGEAPRSIASSKLDEASALLDKVYGKKGDASPREVKDILRDLEKTLGDRLTWTMETCRHLAERLL